MEKASDTRFYRSEGVLCRIPLKGLGVPQVWAPHHGKWFRYADLDRYTDAVELSRPEAKEQFPDADLDGPLEKSVAAEDMTPGTALAPAETPLEPPADPAAPNPEEPDAPAV